MSIGVSALVALGMAAWSAAPTEEAPGAALTKPPRLTQFVEAAAPPSLAERRQVDVVLTIDVDEKGRVTAAQVARSGGPEFDVAALAAARRFVFEPGEVDGRPVPVRITYRYRFALEPPAAPTPPPGPAPATVPLAGKVLRKGDRVALPGVVVIGDGGAARAVTDQGGTFVFPALSPGTHTLQLRGANTAPADLTVALAPGKRVEITVFLEARDRYTSTVRGRRAVVETFEHTLAVEEVKRIPGTQGDTLKAVQNLPGVARAPFGIGLLPVWGSAPQDTRVYVDGVPIPMLYHFGGLRSTVNSEVIQSIAFAPGGFGVEHGLGLGGVVDVETRPPRRDGYHGYAQVDIIDGSLSLEGPLTRTLSFTIAGRRSWLDATLPLFTSSSLQVAPVYYDYLGRLSWRPSARDDIDVLVLGSDDAVKVLASVEDGALAAQFVSHIYDHRLIASWLHRLGSGVTLSLTSSLGLGAPFQLAAQFGSVPTDIKRAVLGYTLRAVARAPIRAWLHIDAGVDFEGGRWTLDRSGNPGVTTDPASGTSGGFGNQGGFGVAASGFAFDRLTLYTNQVAPFVTATVALWQRRLTLTPGVRVQVITSVGYLDTPDERAHAYLSPEPRLAVRYQLSPRFYAKGALGIYHQPPPPEMLSRVFGNPDLSPQVAEHYVLGGGVDLSPTRHIELVAFWKSMHELVVAGENPGDPPAVNDGVGRAYGIEVILRQELSSRLWGWLSYTLSRSERRDHPDQPWHRFQYDQPHLLTLIASYLLPRGFQVGARLRYASGNVFTPVVGAFYDSNSDRYVPVAGQPFSGRLSAFSELDLRVDKTFTFDRWRLSLYLEVLNTYRATNPEALVYNFDFTIPRPVSGLPLLPVLGVRGDF